MDNFYKCLFEKMYRYEHIKIYFIKLMPLKIIVKNSREKLAKDFIRRQCLWSINM